MNATVRTEGNRLGAFEYAKRFGGRLVDMHGMPAMLGGVSANAFMERVVALGIQKVVDSGLGSLRTGKVSSIPGFQVLFRRGERDFLRAFEESPEIGKLVSPGTRIPASLDDVVSSSAAEKVAKFIVELTDVVYENQDPTASQRSQTRGALMGAAAVKISPADPALFLAAMLYRQYASTRIKWASCIDDIGSILRYFISESYSRPNPSLVARVIIYLHDSSRLEGARRVNAEDLITGIGFPLDNFSAKELLHFINTAEDREKMDSLLVLIAEKSSKERLLEVCQDEALAMVDRISIIQKADSLEADFVLAGLAKTLSEDEMVQILSSNIV